MMPDLERARELVAAGGGRLGQPLHVLGTTGSTNDDAKAGARDGAPHGAVWLAEEQSAGRGRHGRTWTAARGESLLFSVLLRLACPPARVPLVSLVAGLAVRDAVARSLGGTQVLVKWPNDVVVRGVGGDAGPDRKIAGILVESSVMGAKVESVVVGIGLNVHTRVFPGELADLATSVALASGPGRDPDRARLLADVLAGLDHDVEHVVHRGLCLVLGRLLAADSLRERALVSEDGSVTGEGAGIDAEGRLLVRQPDGRVVRITSGEVRLRPGSEISDHDPRHVER